MNGTQEIHDDSGIGTSHPKVDDADTIRGGRTHVGRIVWFLHPKGLAEDIHVIIEVCEQNILTKLLQTMIGVSGQPVCHNLLFCFHLFFSNISLYTLLYITM